jgi:large subunit ribosomal protein L15
MKRITVARGGKRGKTSGRGGKGQTARAGNKRRPEWRDIIKKLPKLRGRGVNSHKSIQEGHFVVNLFTLESAFDAGAIVTPATLVEQGIVTSESGRVPRIKILGDGELKKALKITGCFVSESAKAAIEKAGGSIVPFKHEITQEVVVRDMSKAKAAPAPVAKEAKSDKKEKAAKPKSDKPAKAEAKKETKDKPKK